MGRASISIAITSNFNSRGIDQAIASAEKLAAAAVHHKGQFGKAAVDMGASMGLAASRLVTMGKSVAALGDKLTMGVTVPMGLAAAAAVTSAAKIDTAWYNVRKTVDMTEEGYQRLKDGAMSLSEVQPVSAETILNIEALGGQLGITNENLESFAQVVSGLDIATNLDSETAATQLAQFRNIVQMSEDDMDNFASAVVDLGNHTATTEADIMNLALRFASAGHVAGMSNQDILGLSAALAGLGMKADAGGSALSQVINKISTDVAAGGENLQKWADLVGEAPEQFAEAWRSAPTEEFVKVLQEIGKEGADANEILNGLDITQIRQSDAMRRLASSGDLVTDSISRANKAWEENTALTKEVDNRNESLQARWDTLVNRFTNDLARIGQPIAEMGLDAIAGLEPVIQGVGDLAQAFAGANPMVQQFAFNLAGVAMAAGPVLSVTGRVMQAVGNMGVRVGRITQQWGIYKEALNSSDVAMVRNLAEQKTLATQLGLSRNEWVKAAGGIDAWKNKAEAASIVVGENASAVVRNGQAVEGYAKALGVGEGAHVEFTGGVRSSAEAVQFATGVNQRYKEALANGAGSMTEAAQMALQYKDNTSASAVEANRAANEVLGYSGALKSEAKTGTAAAQAALKSASSRKAQKEQTKAANDAVQHMSRAEMDAALATERGRVELDKINESSEKASIGFGKFGDALKGALLGFGATAAIGAVVAGITWIATSMQEAAERADLLDKATNGLRDTLVATGTAADDSAGSHRNLLGAIAESEQKANEAIESQAQLADKFREVDKQAAVQMGTLDHAAGIVEKYANNGSIGAAQLQLLRSAIDEVNQACGTQYEVLEDGSVVYETETGAIQANTDEILRNIDARKRQIELEAVQEKYKEAYENLTEQAYARADAVDKLSEAQERLDELNSRNLTWDEILERQSIVNELPQLRKNVEDLGKTYEEAAEAERYWAQVMESHGEQVSHLSHDMQSLIEPTSLFAAGFSAAQKDVVEFAAACETAGINFDFLNSLTTTEIEHMADTFHGSTRDIIKGLEDLGKTEALNNIGANWRSHIDDASGQIADAIANVHGVSLAELGALAIDLGIEGEEAMQSFLHGIEAGLNSGLNIDQAAQLAQRIKETFGNSLTPEQAAEIAKNFMDNLARHMSDSSALDKAIQDFKQTLASVDFSAEGEHAKQSWLAGFNSGGGSGGEGGKPLKKFTNGIYSELDTLNYTVNEKGEIVGMGWDLGVTEGVQSGEGTVTGAFDGIVGAIMGVLLGGVGKAEGAGAETGSGYGSGVSNQGGTAEIAAMQTLGRLLAIWLAGIMNAQQAGLRTGQAYGQGLASAAAPGIATVQAAISTILAVMQAGVGPAAAAGQAMGRGHGQALAQMMMSAVTATQAAMTSITSAMRAGISPATNAGRQMGTGFRNALQVSALPAISNARSISNSAGAAFGSGSGAAAAGGSALGSAFASAVWSAGGVAIRYARNIRDQVQSIFDSIPTTKTVTLNVKTNVQKTALAMPSSTPAFQIGPGGTVTPFAGASRAAATAERAAMRIRATREANGATATVRALTSAATGRTASVGIDYDAMYRVVKGAMAEAMREAPPVSASIDGHRLMEFVDKGLARRGAMY